MVCLYRLIAAGVVLAAASIVHLPAQAATKLQFVSMNCSAFGPQCGAGGWVDSPADAGANFIAAADAAVTNNSGCSGTKYVQATGRTPTMQDYGGSFTFKYQYNDLSLATWECTAFPVEGATYVLNVREVEVSDPTCQPGQELVNGQCVSMCAGQTGTPLGGYEELVTGTSATPPSLASRAVCASGTVDANRLPAGMGCGFNAKPDAAFWNATRGAWVVSFSVGGTSSGTGLHCDLPAPPPMPDGSTPTDPAGEPSTCPVGHFKGEVNGLETCVPPVPGSPAVTTSSSSQDQTTTNPDGSSTTENKTTDSTTSCKDDKCTTTTTVTVAGGGSTSTTTTQSKGEFCKTKPEDPQCGGMSGFGGQCTQGFTCSGDAVMCAIARGVHEQKCLFNKDSPEAALYESKKGETGSGLEEEVVSLVDRLEDENAIGVAGSCIKDLNVTVWGSAVSLPLSQVCGPLEYFGTLLLGVSWLLAFAIVARK